MSGSIVLALRLLLAIALYAFLGGALWMMWHDLRRSSARIANRKVPTIRLEVRSKKRPAVVRAYSQGEILLGRDPLADVPLSDEAVSARHALLSFHHEQWWLDDLGSTNGTRLNGEKLAGPTVLASGDEIKCGQVSVVVKLAARPLRASSPREGMIDD
jgi:pSer/pThr/pTyr-binding forkhead associated (FHA) protein